LPFDFLLLVLPRSDYGTHRKRSEAAVQRLAASTGTAENHSSISRRSIMSEHGNHFDPNAGTTSNTDILTHPQERLCCLQYMIAFLIEKNEQFRQQLDARRSEEEAYAFPSDQSAENG
jgi:hypothetical protein